MDITIRRACENERSFIALCIAEGFERDFSFFSKKTESVAKALGPGIHPEKFYVAACGEGIVGVAGISDCSGRAVSVDGRACRKHFGWLMGTVARLVLKNEFESPLPYPPGTGFIEFVATRKAFRRRGVAAALLKGSMRQAGYGEYVLDVIEENRPAVACYVGLGFQCFEKKKQKNGYTKMYMRLGMDECRWK